MSRRINLVPPSERVRTTTDVGKLVMGVLIVLVLFAVGLTYYLFSNQLSSKESELADIRQQVQQLKSQTAALERYAKLDEERARTEKAIQEVYAGRTLVGELLDNLSYVVPEEAWFESLAIDTSDPVTTEGPGAAAGGAPPPGKLSVAGNTYSFEQVAQMMVRLKLVPTLAEITLETAGDPTMDSDPKIDVKGFSISAAVVNDQSPDTLLPISQAEVVFE